MWCSTARVRRKSFTLDMGDRRLDVAFTIADRRVTSFSVHLRRLEHGRWGSVERVDTAHGRLHRHRWIDGRETVDDIAPTPPDDDFTASLRQAMQDMRDRHA